MDTSQFKTNTLKQVSEALDAVEAARGKKGLSASDKTALQTASINLRNIERSIEESTQHELADALNADTASLQDLIDQINKSSKKLDKLAGVLQTTAKVVDVFVKIIVQAVAVGLM